MSDADQITEYERYINQVAADTEVTKVVLTATLALLVQKLGTALVDDVEVISKQAMQQGVSAASADALSNRLHHLKMSRMDDYFRDLRALVDPTGPTNRPPASTRN